MNNAAQLTFPTTAAEAHLATVKADINIGNTCARWLAHEAVWPGRGALDMVTAGALRRDRAKLAELTALAAELEEKDPTDDLDLIDWARWARDTLAEAITAAEGMA